MKMDETQYILYEDYLANEAVKDTSNNNHTSITIPSLFITSNQNTHNNFKAEAPAAKNILVNLSSNSNSFDKKIIDNYQTLPISYEVKDAIVLHSEEIASDSVNLSNVESGHTLCKTAMKSASNYQINLPPLTCSEVLPNSTFMLSDQVENTAKNSNAIVTTEQGCILDRNVENLKASLSCSISDSDLVPSESVQYKISKLNKINPEGFVKLLQDDLLKFGTSVAKVIDEIGDETHHSVQIVGKENNNNNNKFHKIKIDCNSLVSKLVDSFHDQVEKAAILQCSQCNMTFSSNDAMANHENNDCLRNLSCIDILNTQASHLYLNKNTDGTVIAKFTKPENILYNCSKCNLDTKNYKLDSKGSSLSSWKCLICLKEYNTLIRLENHYNLHSVQELSKALIKFHDPHYSCSSAVNINGEKESLKISYVERKENQIFNIATCNSHELPLILKEKNLNNKSLNSLGGVDKSLSATELTGETANLKIKPKKNRPTHIKKRMGLNSENVEKIINVLPPNSKETEKNLNNLKKPTKILKTRKKSRSVGSGPGSRDPHQCSICKKVLSSRGNLAKHLIQHQSMKPWSCSSCNASFNSKRDCDQHYLQRHTNIRPFVCQICSKGYVTSKTLDEHMNFHSTDKSFICKLCGKTFLTNKCVRRHMHRHEALKKFNCGMCYKLFRVKEDLFAHIRKVHLTKKKQFDDKFKSSGSNYSLCSSQLEGLEGCVQLQKRKKKEKQKVENLIKFSNSISEVSLHNIHQNDTMKEVAEFFIPTASAAVIFPELCELPSNIHVEKDEFCSNEENYISTLIPLSTQGGMNKYIFNALPSNSRIDSETGTFVMLGLTEDTGTMSANNILNCTSDIPILYKQELSEMQHNKNEQRNIDQIFSTIPSSNPKKISNEHQLMMKNGERNSVELPNEKDKRNLYTKNGILNEQSISKLPHQQLDTDPSCDNEHSHNISLEMISQSLQLDFQDSQGVNNQNSIF